MLQFTINPKLLKAKGYTFQKLFARNYKCYHKRMPSGHTFWLWVKGREIVINDWHEHTKTILEFYQANKNLPEFDKKSAMDGKPLNSIKIQLNLETSQIQLFDYKNYFDIFKKCEGQTDEKQFEIWGEWYKKYENWREIVINRNSFEALLTEIKSLQS